MAYSRATGDQGFAVRVGGLIVGCTAALTLAFFGLFAFLSGATPAVTTRIPLYVLGMAGLFVSVIVWLEGSRGRYEGREVLVAASAVAVIGFVFFTLAGEGLMYAVRNPDQALASQRFLYLVAAGLIGTGVGYWGLHHRNDVARALR